jgi:hypothetical protein
MPCKNGLRLATPIMLRGPSLAAKFRFGRPDRSAQPPVGERRVKGHRGQPHFCWADLMSRAATLRLGPRLPRGFGRYGTLAEQASAVAGGEVRYERLDC